MRRQKFYLIAICLALVVIIGVIIISLVTRHSSSPPVVSRPSGTSKYPQFDIVSSEITPDDVDSIVSNIESYTGTTLKPGDITIRSGSYKKSYQSDGLSYSISMLIDTRLPDSTYSATIQTQSGVPTDTVEVSCAPAAEQINKTTGCVNRYEGSL